MRLALFAIGVAASAGLACSSKPLTSDPPDCTGLPVQTIACAVGPTVTTCVRDANGHPGWVISCPGESTGGSTGAGGSSGSGGTGGTDAPPPEAFTVTFDLQNAGAAPLYVYEGCLLELTLTELSDPPHVIGRASGCGVCDCAATSCPLVTCGPCYAGGLEVGAGGHLSYVWSAVDETAGTHGTSACWSTRVLPAGHYRIDVPVYASADDAAARTGARTATQTFDLPAGGNVAVPLAVSP